MPENFHRRGFLTAAAAGLGGLVSGCDRIADSSQGRSVLNAAESVTYRVQRMLLGEHKLAREYSEADITPNFRANGTNDPQDQEYKALAANNFVDWRLRVDGLVEHPLCLALTDLRTFPARTQITRHDCVEGWSCIGKWTGTPLSAVLARARIKSQAKFVVFHCADTMETSGDGKAIRYYESIDLIDALHPQTILAYEMNGKTLPIAYGAPIRVRIERQLGYKMAKYVMRVELADTMTSFGEGNGGYWEDRGYEWYAGI